MNSIKEVRDFEFPTTVIWDIISDISRCDWVPGVESIELKGNKRIFKMSGMGRLVEEILECSDSKMELTYSAIETMAPIGHHLAKIKLYAKDEGTVFEWTTEIDPPEFSDAIQQGMLAQMQLMLKTTKSSWQN